MIKLQQSIFNFISVLWPSDFSDRNTGVSFNQTNAMYVFSHQWTQNKTNLAKVMTFYLFLKNTVVCRIFSGLFTNDSVQKRRCTYFCILRLKAWQLRWYYFWRRLLIPIHSTLRVWYDISNFPSILLPLLYFIKGQEISKFNGPILIIFKKRTKFFLNFDLSCLDQNLEIILYLFWIT